MESFARRLFRPFYFGAELSLVVVGQNSGVGSELAGVVGQNSGVRSGLVGVVGQNSVSPLPPFGDSAATGMSPCPSWAGLLERVAAMLFSNAAAFLGAAFTGHVLESVAMTRVGSQFCQLVCVLLCSRPPPRRGWVRRGAVRPSSPPWVQSLNCPFCLVGIVC